MAGTLDVIIVVLVIAIQQIILWAGYRMPSSSPRGTIYMASGVLGLFDLGWTVNTYGGGGTLQYTSGGCGVTACIVNLTQGDAMLLIVLLAILTIVSFLFIIFERRRED